MIFFCIFTAIIYINEVLLFIGMVPAGGRNVPNLEFLLAGGMAPKRLIKYVVETMNTIIRRIIINISILCLLTAAWTQFFAFADRSFDVQILVITILIIAAGVILIYLLLKDIKNLKIARLIRENFILKVKTAVISEIAEKEISHKPIHIDDTEIFVSYFGILFNGKIVKFNQEGVRLTAMDIGNDFISFTYGNDKQMQNLRIVRPDIEPEAMDEMINKFRFETGITPSMR